MFIFLRLIIQVIAFSLIANISYHFYYKASYHGLVGPTDLGGWSYRFALVRSSVHPSVLSFARKPFIGFLIFCIKLAFSKSKKPDFLTKPDFRKKKLFGPNLRFLVNYSSLNHMICLILHILTDKHDI